MPDGGNVVVYMLYFPDTVRFQQSALRLFRSWWRVIVVIMTPLVFLPIPIVLKDDVSIGCVRLSVLSSLAYSCLCGHSHNR